MNLYLYILRNNIIEIFQNCMKLYANILIFINKKGDTIIVSLRIMIISVWNHLKRLILLSKSRLKEKKIKN